jgi:dolichol-phosphate mannosyltransferase
MMFDGTWELPSFKVHEFSRRTSRYCVIVPVLNEGVKFLGQLDKMAEEGFGADIVVADGGSDDGSTEPCELAARGVTALLTKTGPGKLSAQLRMAFAWALSQSYEGAVIIDGNGKDGVAAIPAFLAALDAGFGFVQGSRYAPGGKAINTPLDRHLAVRLFHAPLVSLGAGFRYTDTTNGFRAFSAGFLSDPEVAVFRDIFDTYNLHYYLAIRAPRLGYKVCELPVERCYPAKGRTPTKIAGLRGRLLILRQLWTAVTGGYNPGVAKGER